MYHDDIYNLPEPVSGGKIMSQNSRVSSAVSPNVDENSFSSMLSLDSVYSCTFKVLSTNLLEFFVLSSSLSEVTKVAFGGGLRPSYS